ncbi:MAG: succinate--CoA ligase subunit beta, partial [Gammaproteobacteria bacterium]|nr:succinate--CoA ligase subunit beta [Gammaproteobacteria bacterium]
MNLHEYQAKDLFRSYGLPVPNGKVAFSASEAVDVAKSLNGNQCIVKA